MNIAIWDLDWYSRQSFIPNVKCMKLASYHKQKQDSVFLVEEEHHLSLAYDVMYIVREKETTQLPARRYLDDKRSILIGDGFKMFKSKQLGAIIMACRPDYLLYTTEERDKYGNANFVTFYAGTTLIKNKQDYHNTKLHHHFTIVADKWFWKATDEEIIYCLDNLKNDKNLMFFEPISLNRILSNDLIREKFLQLHYAKGTPFKWKNDYSSENVEPIIQFLLQLKQITKSDLGFIPIKSNVEDDEELNVLRCLQIICKFKQNQLRCVIINNKGNSIFEGFEIWTRYAYKLSYVEFILHNYCARHGLFWFTILNNSTHWYNAKIDYLLYLLTNSAWDAHRHLLFSQWGSDVLNEHKINYEYIKEHINLLYKEFKNE